MQYNPFCCFCGEDPEVRGLVESLCDAPLDVAVRRKLADALERRSPDAYDSQMVSLHRRMADAIEANPDLGGRIETALARANVGCHGHKIMTTWQGTWTTLQAIARSLFGEEPSKSMDGSQKWFGVHEVGPHDAQELDDRETQYRGKVPVFLAVVRADGRICVDGASVEKNPEPGWWGSPTKTAWPELAYPVPPMRGEDDPKAWSDDGELYAPDVVWEHECDTLQNQREQAWAATR